MPEVQQSMSFAGRILELKALETEPINGARNGLDHRWMQPWAHGRPADQLVGAPPIGPIIKRPRGGNQARQDRRGTPRQGGTCRHADGPANKRAGLDAQSPEAL